MGRPEVGNTKDGLFLKLPSRVKSVAEQLATLEGLSLEQYFSKLVYNDYQRVKARSLPISTRIVKGVIDGLPTEVKQIISSIGQKRK